MKNFKIKKKTYQHQLSGCGWGYAAKPALETGALPAKRDLKLYYCVLDTC